MNLAVDSKEWLPSRETLLFAGLVVNTELVFVLLYFVATGATLTPVRYTLYGLVWITVGIWAIVTTRVAPSNRRTKRVAALVAVGYFAVLAVAGGLVTAALPGGSEGVRVVLLQPGWGPALIYNGDVVNLILMPARVVGYLALTYLVYATVVDAAGAAVTGVLGLLSCVSCSWPILASLATGVFGSGSALAAATTSLSYDLSTLVFVVTVALLYWRPFGR
ncbi:MAG: DUF7546 family protein [Halobacteriota archaeon]